jgi:putative flippase GtrA
MISRTFVYFVLAGGAAAAANFGSRMLLNIVMPYVPAIVLAYLIGMVAAFALNRLFVFQRSTRHLSHQAFWFTIVNLFALVQTVLVSLLFADFIFPASGMNWYPATVAHAVGVVCPVFTSYLGHKRLSFRVG